MRVAVEAYRLRARVEGVGHDLREDALLHGARIGVPDVFQEMLQIDARLAQDGGILSQAREAAVHYARLP